jgi:hypothetical protein
MTSSVLSREFSLLLANQKIQSTAPPAKSHFAAWTWRTVCDTAVGVAFSGLLVWQLFRIGHELILLAEKVAAVRMSGLI